MTQADTFSIPADFDPVAYINEPRWRSSRLGLDRIEELMRLLGNPQDALRFVHVAGTNGKGSTCAFLASILQQAGYKTGLFTSPYIIEFAERIRVDGINISAEDLRNVTWEVRRQACKMQDHPTEFELMTAVALMYFAKCKCDIVVLEVGLGGRLDSTNVIAAPCVCALTPIALDHMEMLGSTIEQIAFEKAGIIKHGSAVVMAEQELEAQNVIERVCSEKACDLRKIDSSALCGVPADFSYKSYRNLKITLCGSYQIQNAALAIEAALALRRCSFEICDEDIRRGLFDTRWPGRFEVVAENPKLIVDGGHNPQGAQALASSFQLNFPGRKVVFIMGVLADKDYPSMIETLLPLARAFVCIEPPNPRALPASDLLQAIYERIPQGEALGLETAEDMKTAVERARLIAGAQGLVCACGSLYSIAELMSAL